MAADNWIPYDLWPPADGQTVTVRFLNGEIRRDVSFSEELGWNSDEYENIVPPFGGSWRPQ